MNSRKADEGSAEIIGFVLIIALIVSVMSVWILIYLPNEGNAVEIDHTRLVTGQFADLKYGIDLLWITGQEGVRSSRLISPSPVEGTEISGLLFLSPPLGTGTITVGEGTNFKINGNTVKALKITYNSANYYASDVRIVYDGGVVFRAGNDVESLVLLEPAIGDDRLVIIAVSDDVAEQQLLGNIPLSFTYTYDTVTYYNNATVTFTADASNPWTSLISSGKTYANVTVVRYDASIGGPQS
jgi:hypothetical protein